MVIKDETTAEIFMISSTFPRENAEETFTQGEQLVLLQSNPNLIKKKHVFLELLVIKD